MDRRERLRKMLDQVDPSWKAEGLKETLESRTSFGGGPKLDVRRVDPARMESAVAHESLDVLIRGEEIDSEQQFVLEAVVMPYHRPVVDVIDDYIKTSQLTKKWQSLGDEARRPWIRQCLRSVGRINVPNLPSLPYAGTAFIAGDGLLMTNRHVASIFARGVGSRFLQFEPESAAVNFYHEIGRATSESLIVEEVVMIHPWWDMALLRVRGLSPDRIPLRLSTEDPATLEDREVIVVGYPGYDPDPDEEFQRIQNRIFRGTYFVKRFQPGLFKVREKVESCNRVVEAVTHDCSTLGGNSGSAVIDVQTGRVVGLHFAGDYLIANYAVSPHDLAQDSRVVDAGVNFEGRVAPRGDFYGPVWRDADSAEFVAGGDNPTPEPKLQAPASAGPTTSSAIAQSSTALAAANLTIPIQVSATIGTPKLVGPTAPGRKNE